MYNRYVQKVFFALRKDVLMKLYTECFWDDWDRIVDIYTERCDTLPDYINDFIGNPVKL